jgi:TolA-binding protein
MIKCVNCGFLVDEDFNYCPNCGSAVIKEDPLQNRSSQGHQLKITMVICDICGENTGNKKGFCENCGAKLSGKEKNAESGYGADNKVSQEVSRIKKDKNKENSKSKNKETKNFELRSKQQFTSNGKKSLTNVQISIIAGTIVIAVFAVLLASGVFESDTGNNLVNEGGANTESKIDLTHLQEINKLEKVINSDTTNLSNVLDLAHRLNDSGFYEKAIGYYQMYLRHNPKNPDVQIDLGVCYFELKKYEKAKEEMLKGIKIDPKHQIGLFNLGVVNLAEGNLDSAKYWWKKTLDINENSEIAKKAKQLLESH